LKSPVAEYDVGELRRVNSVPPWAYGVVAFSPRIYMQGIKCRLSETRKHVG